MNINDFCHHRIYFYLRFHFLLIRKMTTWTDEFSGQSNPGYVDTEENGDQGNVLVNNNRGNTAESTIHRKFNLILYSDNIRQI